MIYLVTELMRHATDFSVLHEDKYKVTAAVAASMRVSMLERGFPSYASNKILLLATILDPRYKTAGLPNDEAVQAAKGILTLVPFLYFLYCPFLSLKASYFGRHLCSTIATMALMKL